MDREVVVSVSIRAVGYDREASTLEIEFCDEASISMLTSPKTMA
jgi:hypothetical protein